ncbi:MAG: nucleotidyltransferase domain-containing protein [Verrucomicrobia bacterium]|nr:nucleotidyltransferase domain-containing protein [Deltaproteobacteria bacterium]
MKTEADIPPITLNPRDWSEVQLILKRFVPEYTVWAFGSRATGTAKPYSDLDLAILTDQPLSIERMATIKDAFDESDLPIRVDVVDWAVTSASFREIIKQNYVVVQQGTVGKQ